MKKVTPEAAFNKMAALCSLSEHAESDIRERLQKAALSDEEIQKIIVRLYEEDYLNTSRYCRAFAHDRLRFAHWGRVKIQQALRMKGLPQSDIKEAIDNLPDDEYLAALQATLEQKARSIGDDDEYARRAKLIRFAAARGFTPSEILDELG